MSRFFISAGDIDGNKATIRNPIDIKHILKVLRCAPGDRIELSDGNSFEYLAEITACGRDAVEAVILDKQGFSREPELDIYLYQGIPKQGKMETIIQKAVELGVNTIIPVFMARSVVADKGNSAQKAERWQKISDEAVKQCKRGIIPAVERAIPFNAMLSKMKEQDLILFPYENEKNVSIKDVLRSLQSKPKSVAIVIGPEGGFSDSEADMLVQAGALKTTLGKTTLRTETAGAAAIAMVMYELEL